MSRHHFESVQEYLPFASAICILFNLIWRNRSHYLRKDILRNLRKDGGLEVLTFETLIHFWLDG